MALIAKREGTIQTQNISIIKIILKSIGTVKASGHVACRAQKRIGGLASCAYFISVVKVIPKKAYTSAFIC